MSTRGRFIVFEGGEACGKSTQALLLSRAIEGELTREPGGTPFAEEIRALLLSERTERIDPRTELLLMTAARAQHVAERIAPALQAGRHVVCDRFTGSTLAYQGYGRGLPLDDVELASRVATAGVEPDIVILLDLPLELARARMATSADRIESEGEAFHERVRAGFLELAAKDEARWVVIDGSPPADEVFARVRSAVSSRLGC